MKRVPNNHLLIQCFRVFTHGVHKSESELNKQLKKLTNSETLIFFQS